MHRIPWNSSLVTEFVLSIFLLHQINPHRSHGHFLIYFFRFPFDRASRKKSGFHLGKSSSEPNLTGDFVYLPPLELPDNMLEAPCVYQANANQLFTFQIISRRDSRIIWRNCCTSTSPLMNWNSIASDDHRMRKMVILFIQRESIPWEYVSFECSSFRFRNSQ